MNAYTHCLRSAASLPCTLVLLSLLFASSALAAQSIDKNTPVDGYHNSDAMRETQTPMQRDVAPYNEQRRNRNPHTKSNGPQSNFHDYNITPKANAAPPSRGYYSTPGSRALDSGSRPWRSY